MKLDIIQIFMVQCFKCIEYAFKMSSSIIVISKNKQYLCSHYPNPN